MVVSTKTSAQKLIPFRLESLVRHEEVTQREIEERQRKEREGATMRNFKAWPVLKEKQVNLCSTTYEIKNLQIKEGEEMYKRWRERRDTALKFLEKKALKQWRRTLVHRARLVPNFQRPQM
ncbi:hypothetical protein Ddye_026863 [Dipteronia dyeriana]|uniref:TPX2 C-terminal domain-containing protein n=1 Tax=Dipteronia dyeriana TaxID=168575 RepID=A0AAD9TNT0_9ROSI|nr:hypothetical protein Ddye_026863 [Dipteronia dyeriana]